MGTQIKVLQKGKITIPADIRERLGISEGDHLKLEIVGNKLVLLPPNTVPNPTELLCGLAEGIPITEPVKQELRRAATARVEKKASRTEK
ncbi:MAG: AbrB/MazE/SpoVT family DNA-binding domain-containing protein [Candidatus Geothermarchaeales archaeon]